MVSVLSSGQVLHSVDSTSRKQMDQDPGQSITQGNEFTIGCSLTILLPRPVLVTIKHLANHLFAGCTSSKFNNNLSPSVFNALCECFAYIILCSRSDEGLWRPKRRRITLSQHLRTIIERRVVRSLIICECLLRNSATTQNRIC